MALRQLAFATPVRTALRSGQRALLSYSTGIPTGILGAATGASGVTPFTSGLAERFSTDSVTAKFGDPSFWEGEYSAQVIFVLFSWGAQARCSVPAPLLGEVVRRVVRFIN